MEFECHVMVLGDGDRLYIGITRIYVQQFRLRFIKESSLARDPQVSCSTMKTLAIAVALALSTPAFSQVSEWGQCGVSPLPFVIVFS